MKLYEYTEFVGLYDADDQCTVNIEITKSIVDSTFSVYMFNTFVENVLKDEIYKVLSLFSMLLLNQDHLIFQCFEKNAFLENKNCCILGNRY